MALACEDSAAGMVLVLRRLSLARFRANELLLSPLLAGCCCWSVVVEEEDDIVDRTR